MAVFICSVLFSSSSFQKVLERHDFSNIWSDSRSLQYHSSSSDWTGKSTTQLWLPLAKSVQWLEERYDQSLSYLSDLSVLVLFFCLPASLPKHPSLEEVQFIVGQSFSQGAEEAVVVGCVVDHEQDSSQQLIGHQQVVQVCPLVVLTAVAATPLHQGPEVVLVAGKKFKKFK